MMSKSKTIGHAGLVGWRKALAVGVARAVAADGGPFPRIRRASDRAGCSSRLSLYRRQHDRSHGPLGAQLGQPPVERSARAARRQRRGRAVGAAAAASRPATPPSRATVSRLERSITPARPATGVITTAATSQAAPRAPPRASAACG